MPQYHELTDEILQRIDAIFGESNVISQPEKFEQYEKDGSSLRFKPDLVVKAKKRPSGERTSEAGQRIRVSRDSPRRRHGPGRRLSARTGGVILSLEDMNRILSIDKTNLIGEVEPGVITQRFRDSVRSQGLFYPPDPAGMDKSTLGGNAATNAGGPACVKYGTTKDYILGLEVVLPSGQIIKTGVKTRKGVVGYDLTHLLVGSEGTLGVITSLTFKLIPHPPAVKGIAAVFPA